MGMTSFAQNQEDVRLMHLFAEQSTGTFVDVGGNDPVYFSTTKHFYDQGWCGMTFEPNPVLHQRFVQQRPKDVNLCVGASSAPGELTFYQAPIAASGLSTFSIDEATRLRAMGTQFEERPVQVVRLNDALAEHFNGRPIDFMSVDVEGHEREVLEGLDLRRFRPRVLLVEATRPLSQEPSHERWEQLILQGGYRFAVFDGLNRFYAREENPEDVAPLALAPNIFDGFVPYQLQCRITELEREVDTLRARFTVPVKVVREVDQGFRRIFRAARNLLTQRTDQRVL